MGEDISKWYIQQGVKIQTVQRIHTTQHQKKKKKTTTKPDLKMGR